MALDPSYVGKTYPPVRSYMVGREKIREFATAIGATDPAYHDPEAARALGYPDVIGPPTFPTVPFMIARMPIIEDPGLGLDYSRVVHGDQRFAYTRPVVAGDELLSSTVIEEIMTRGGHEFFTTRTDMSTPAGEPVVSVWCKLVVRGEG